jgi:hypothetical protein
VRIPEKYKKFWPSGHPGSKVDRLISFVDLASTMLSLTGLDIPDYMQGAAFLGKQKSDDPAYSYMFRGRMDERYDLCRAVRDQKYRYIRNYMPFRIYGQNLYYLWLAPSVRAWEASYNEGSCNKVQSIFWNVKPAEELYDTENDPWEVKNLADNPAYELILKRMRKANQDWMIKIKDSGLIPEAELSSLIGEKPAYDYMRSGKIQYEELLSAAERATLPSIKDLDYFINCLKSEYSWIRYWGATGIMMLGPQGNVALSSLEGLLSDPSYDVIAAASEALYQAGKTVEGSKGLAKVLQSDNQFARLHALNVIESRKIDSRLIRDEVIKMAKKAGKLTLDNYDQRAAKRLFDVWGIDVKFAGIEVTW